MSVCLHDWTSSCRVPALQACESFLLIAGMLVFKVFEIPMNCMYCASKTLVVTMYRVLPYVSKVLVLRVYLYHPVN